MRVFKSLADVAAARLCEDVGRVARDVVRTLVDAYVSEGYVYDPDGDGFAVLVEEGDSEEAIRAVLGWSLLDAPLEGCVFERGCFVTVILRDNQFGISIIVPDAPWLDPALQARDCETNAGDVCSGSKLLQLGLKLGMSEGVLRLFQAVWSSGGMGAGWMRGCVARSLGRLTCSMMLAAR